MYYLALSMSSLGILKTLHSKKKRLKVEKRIKEVKIVLIKIYRDKKISASHTWCQNSYIFE